MFTITSSAFKEGNQIPSLYTCDDKDISPPLAWHDIPHGTKSLTLICDDPDAISGTFVHWVLYNISPTVKSLEEHISADRLELLGIKEGISDFGTAGYGGPCPPSGNHRYVFKLYALDMTLSLSGPVRKNNIEQAIQGHIIEQAQLIGKYTRQ